MRSLLIAVVLTVAIPPLSATDPEGITFFEAKVRPLLAEQCLSCHSEATKKSKGGLRLDAKSMWLKGGASGPAVVPGEPDKSPLILAVRRKHKDYEAMPPDKELSPEQVAILVEWVKRGAPAPDEAKPVKSRESITDAKKRWPFTSLPKAIAVPPVKNTEWTKSDIDRFILAKLESKQLSPVGDADRRTLIRRATYDLTGLPPTPEEVDAFVADTSPKAFEKVIDRLLASPHYGERWGRHWLDVVRYADTAGDNSDFPIPQMYRYRNWVIDAVNNDVPYDRFVREQIAGDLISGGSDEEKQQRIVATGYIANARRFGSRVDDYPQHLTIEDTLDNFGRAFLGLTLNCARCHDHKFDPLDTKDYYALYGVFHSTRYPWPGIELDQKQRDLVPLVPEEQVKPVLEDRESKNKEFNDKLNKLYADKGKAADDKTKSEAIQKEIDAVKKEQRKLINSPLPFPVAYAVAEGKKIEHVAIQLKGDPTKPGAIVPRGIPEVFGGTPISPGDKTSGRLAVANWLTAPDHPLFARVFVNRVWLHHFGRGIVPTPNDFGKQGTPASHPELLDWLARSFVNDGYSLKRLHKRIMLSHAYQLASNGRDVQAELADPTNELIGLFRRRRLDAESIRDSLLAHGGSLDRTPGEAHPFPDPTTWAFTQHNPFRAVYDTNKRSVFLMSQRIQRHPYLAIFDGPDPSASTGSRGTSTTTLQSLYFLNDLFVHKQADGLAKRLQAERSNDRDRIDLAYRLLVARPATTDEVDRGVAYLAQVKDTLGNASNDVWPSYVRSLFRLNEFVYLD